MSVQVAVGSVPGGHHKNIMKNNQDAYHVASTDSFTVAVIADGCGSGRFSEMGAHLGAQIVCHAIKRSLGLIGGNPSRSLVEGSVHFAKSLVIKRFRDLFESCCHDEREICDLLMDYGLFTLVIAIWTKDHYFVYAQGDGCYAVLRHGEETLRFNKIEPMEGNMPPYVCYEVSDMPKVKRDELVLQLMEEGPSDSIYAIVLGSDGLLDYKRPSEAHPESVEALVKGWLENDKTFKNPHALQRQLNVLNAGGQSVDYNERRVVRVPHAFEDDCTVAMLCRQKSTQRPEGELADEWVLASGVCTLLRPSMIQENKSEVIS